MPPVMVPYYSNGAGRAMYQRALTTVGTRRDGRALYAPPTRPMLRGLGCDCGGGAAAAPGPGLMYDTDAALPLVPYEAAKRMSLGALGATSTVGSAATGAKIGASVGSAIPVVGTAIGAILGGIGGAISAAFNRQDQEVQNFDQAQAIARANGPQAVVNIANKYLVLAGLFDLQPGQIKGNIPWYKQYGRMGEQRFVTDMMTLIYQAAQSGRITANDTPQTVYQNIVLPWVSSWGKGALQDSNAEMLTWIIIGMIAEYVSGLQSQRWFARGGQYPFGGLPRFSLPVAPAALPPVAIVPTPVASPPVSLPTVSVPTVNTQPVRTGACTAPYVWNGTQCVVPLPTQPAPTLTPAPGSTPAVAPAGFTVVGADANGAPIFANAQGVLYSYLNGQYVQFTGAVGGNASVAAQVQAAIQNALAQGYTPAQAAQQAVASTQATGAVVPPAIQAQAADQAATTAAAPLAAGVAPTGVMGWIAAGLGVVTLILATARPAKPYKGRRRA